MSTAAARRTPSVEEYLRRDADAQDARYEYIDGRIYALAGAEPAHNLIKDNIQGELYQQLRPRGCRSFTSDQRVRISATRYVYPDVVVVCGAPEYTDERPASLANPELLVEVISPSTAGRDHKEKLDVYLQLPELKEYWIVESERPFLVQYVRRAEEWIVRPVRGLEATVQSDHFDVELAMEAIYALAAFPSEEEADDGAD